MDATLIIHADTLDEEELRQLTQSLQKKINRETDIHAEPIKVPGEVGEVGEKGLKELFGQLKLTDLKVAIGPLLNVLKTVFKRSENIEIELQRPDGGKAALKINKSHLEKSQIDRTLRMLEQFLQEK